MHRDDRTSSMLIGGVIVLVGLGLLVRNLTDLSMGSWNWWALFILIPAVGSLASAWSSYQSEGRITLAARGPLLLGVGLLLASLIFLFDLSWSALWPIFLILFGVGALLVR